MSKKVNPITIRSKKWIVNALGELMKEKPYADITIKEISERSGLVRQTVYRNFHTKEDILKHYIDDFYKEFINLIFKKEAITLYELLVTYFYFWIEKEEFVRNLVQNNVFSMILESHLKYLYSMGKDYRFENLIFYEGGETTDYVYHFSAGGLWYILKKWIEDNMKKSPEEMADIVLNFYHIKRLNLQKIRREKNKRV
ncbi:TetR/AcrR family transcriptional regulator [Mycoplasmatota bacterium zrk1]